jgi:hypothetical protein
LKNWFAEGGETVTTFVQIKVMLLLVPSCPRHLRCFFDIFSKPHIRILQR